jgi:hypothetical protein
VGFSFFSTVVFTFNLGQEDNAMVHVRFEGRSFGFDEQGLKLSGYAFASDSEVKLRVARRLDVAVEKLDMYVVDRFSDGNLVIRPDSLLRPGDIQLQNGGYGGNTTSEQR